MTGRAHSLKTRTALVMLVVLLAGLWSLTFIVAGMLRKDLQQELGAQQLGTVALIAGEIDQQFGDRLDALRHIADSAEGMRAMTAGPDAMQVLLEQRSVLQVLFNGGVIAYDRHGTAIGDVPAALGRRGLNFMDIDVVAAALREGRTTIGRPVIGKKLKVPVVGMAVPVRDGQGQVIGALAGVVNLTQTNFISRVIAENKYGRTGDFILVAPQYRLIVTASDKSRIMETLPPAGVIPAIDGFIDGKEGSAILVNPKKAEVLVSVKRVPVAGWYLAAILPTEEAFAPLYRLQNWMLMTTALLSLLGCGGVWWLLGRQLAPILDASSRLAAWRKSGQPLQMLPVRYGDEVGELIESLNESLAAISQKDAALRESSRFTRQVIENAQEGIIVYGPDLRYQVWNPFMAMLSGMSAEDVLGRHPREVFAFLDTDGVVGRVERALAGETLAAVELTFETEDGRKGWVHDQTGPLRDDGGRVVGAISCVRDITAIKATELRFRDMVNTTDGIVWEADARTFGFTFISQKAETLLGFPVEDWYQPGFWVEHLHPEDRVWAPEFCASCTGRLEPHNFEYRFIAKDGRSVWLHDIVTVVAEDGGPRWLRGIMIDVTERKVTEKERELYRKFFEASAEIMGIADPKGAFRKVNPAFLSRLGYDESEILARPFIDFVHPDDRQSTLDEMARQMESGHTLGFVNRYLCKDGSVRWLSWRATFARDEGITYAVATDVTDEKLARDALQESEERFARFMDALPGAAFIKEADGRTVYGNAFLHALVAGKSVESARTEALFPPEVAAEMVAADRRALEEGHIVVEETVPDADGRPTFYETHKFRIPRAGRPPLLGGIAMDITARKVAEERMREALVVFNASNQGIMITDAAGQITSVNPAFTNITGYSADEVIGRKPSVLRSGRHDEAFYAAMWAALQEHGVWEGEVWNRRHDGIIFPEWLTISAVTDPQGRVVQYVGLFNDITERKQHEEAIWYKANFDALTGLANRNLFADRLERAIAQAGRNGKKVGLAFLDLDGFKWINDTLGHDIGDGLLVEVARRITAAVRNEDTVARLGGDEFTVIVQDVRGAHDMLPVGEKLVDILRDPFLLGGGTHQISGSVGITLFPDHAGDVQSLLKNADIAMYRAKQAGKNCCQLYVPCMQVDQPPAG